MAILDPRPDPSRPPESARPGERRYALPGDRPTMVTGWRDEAARLAGSSSGERLGGPRSTRRVGVDLTTVAQTASGDPASDHEFGAGPDRNTVRSLQAAAWKALRCPESVPPAAIELRFDDEGSLRDVRCGGRRFTAGATVLSPWPDHLLSVVWIDGVER